MRYYIFEGDRRVAEMPTAEDAITLAGIREQTAAKMKLPREAQRIIRGETEELIPCKGKRHEKVTPEEKHRYYYIIRDGRLYKTVTSRKTAIDSIREQQAQEDHYLLTSGYSIIYGDSPEEV